MQSADCSNPPSFVEDVIPLLTRLGCNQGACHGKNDGRNGFRLSLRGYAPELDIERLTRESRGGGWIWHCPSKVCCSANPLAWSLTVVAHCSKPGGREYKVLLAWLKAGAPGPLAEEPHVERIELTPANPVLRISQQQLGQQQPMQLRAQYTDGRWRDVTWLTQFATNDANVVEITPAGLVQAKLQGEATVRAHFRGQVAVATITIPFDTPVDPARLSQRNNFIDEHVFNKLAALRIPPAELCSDSAFLRRAYLDTIGPLPTPDEVRGFLADSHPDKRARAIDSLLARPEFVDYWTLQWSDLLQNRKERDHDVRGAKGVHAMQRWLREQVAANRPWDQMVRDLLTVSGKSSEHPEVGYYIVNVGEQQGADRSERGVSRGPGILGHADRLREVSQSSAGKIYAGRLLPFRRLFLGDQAGSGRGGQGADDALVRGLEAGPEIRHDAAAHGKVSWPANIRRRGVHRRSERRSARETRGLDHRSEEYVLQRSNSQSALEPLFQRRPGRTGG